MNIYLLTKTSFGIVLGFMLISNTTAQEPDRNRPQFLYCTSSKYQESETSIECDFAKFGPASVCDFEKEIQSIPRSVVKEVTREYRKCKKTGKWVTRIELYPDKAH